MSLANANAKPGISMEAKVVVVLGVLEEMHFFV